MALRLTRAPGLSARSTPAAILLLALVSTGGCKGARGLVGEREGAAPGDGGVGIEAGAALVVDSGAPADDSIPPTSSDELTTRARHLLEAVTNDDPDLAIDIVFPRSAWLTMRDSSDPAREWDKRVDRPFRRALHRLSKHADGAHFVSLELGHAVLQEPIKRHGWKKPLWSVHDSRLTYIESGHTRTISIREMTAWRGAWYITRLR